jgi:hypothetical protein
MKAQLQNSWPQYVSVALPARKSSLLAFGWEAGLGHRAGLDAVDYRQFSCSCLESILDLPAARPTELRLFSMVTPAESYSVIFPLSPAFFPLS